MPDTIHRTGYLYQDHNIPFDAEHMEWGPAESWHRTFKGALRAKMRNKNRGRIYRILSDDQTELVPHA